MHTALRMPLIKNEPGNNFQVKYDSVTDETRGCKVYMTYCNENTDPASLYNILLQVLMTVG